MLPDEVHIVYIHTMYQVGEQKAIGTKRSRLDSSVVSTLDGKYLSSPWVLAENIYKALLGRNSIVPHFMLGTHLQVWKNPPFSCCLSSMFPRGKVHFSLQTILNALLLGLWYFMYLPSKVSFNFLLSILKPRKEANPCITRCYLRDSRNRIQGGKTAPFSAEKLNAFTCPTYFPIAFSHSARSALCK